VSLVARGLNATNRTPRAQHLFARSQARLAVRTGGRLGGRWFGAPVLVLEVRGRRSGQLRRTPVIYLRDGERYVVMAANAGNDRTPAWWLNLKAAGSAVAVVRGRRIPVRAREVTGPERDRLWRAFAEMEPRVLEYATFTDRAFPLVVLEPR
jgi:F420H(2)-dependent quinone reductase